MSDKDFNWKAYQKYLRWTDEDLEIFKADPKRAAGAASRGRFGSLRL